VSDPFKKLNDRKISERLGSKCLLCKQVHALPKQKVRQYRNALIDRSIMSGVIVDVLADWGVKTSETTVTNHRNNRSPRCTARLEAAVK